MKPHQEQVISIGDLLTQSEANVFIFPSLEQLASVKKEQIILTLLRIEDLKKRIAKSPKNCVLKLALSLAKRRMKSLQKQYRHVLQLLQQEN
ncbi:MAG: hypothetical protein HKO00_02220 [Flavobacteriaceae bacterium]|nr:hypothetical protein [Flavobacteriaceae bacterium]